jgi:hypothetical protein
MITHTIDITEFFPPDQDMEIQKLDINFIQGWGIESISKLCYGRFSSEKNASNKIANTIYSMGGPAITLHDQTENPMMIFDQHKMTMGDISYQVNVFFDHVMERIGDVKGLTNAIYSLYLGLIEGIISETKQL